MLPSVGFLRLNCYFVSACLVAGILFSVCRQSCDETAGYRNPKFVSQRAPLSEFVKDFETCFETELFPSNPTVANSLITRPLTDDGQCLQQDFCMTAFGGTVQFNFHTWFNFGYVSGGTITFKNDFGENWELEIQHLGNNAIVSTRNRIPPRMLQRFQDETINYVIRQAHYEQDLFTLQMLYGTDQGAPNRSSFELELVHSIVKQILLSSLFDIPNRFQKNIGSSQENRPGQLNDT